MNVLKDSKTWNAETSATVLEMQQIVVDELQPKQKAKIEQLRQTLKDALQPCHNDFFLLRWLKVRKFDVGQAEKSIRAHLKWREDTQIDNAHEVFKPPEVVWKYYPLGLSGQDKNGNLVWIMPSGQLDLRGLVYSAKPSDQIKYSMCTFEYVQRMSQIQSEKIGKLVTSQTLIMDFDGFRIKDYLWKPALQLSLPVTKQLVQNYPDIFGKIFVINAPKVFSIFYTMLKPFLSDEFKNVMKIYGKDNWKEDVLEAIDADQLPVHWGGTQVDEVDGNPYCSTKIGMAGPIPKTYYAGLSRKEPEHNSSLETTTIEAKKSFKMDFHVNTPGSTLNWTFGTEQNDIAFGISFKPSNGDSEIEIIPIEKFECYFVPEEGTLLCDQAGLYVVTLDNSYSWFKSKKVYYDVKVTPPNAEPYENGQS